MMPRPRQQEHEQHEQAQEEEEEASSINIDLQYSVKALGSLLHPVALCMVLAALLVAYVQVDAQSKQQIGFNQVLPEDEGDSVDSKLSAAVVNTLLILSLVIAATVLMVVLFYFRCTKLLIGYFAFSCFMLLAFSNSFLLLQTFSQYQVSVDSLSFTLFAFNFAVMGTLSIFYRAPSALKAFYLIVISVVLTWMLTQMPEWTGWALLIGISLYDICAVLTPCGPLKWLIRLSEERDEPIPALLYEAEVQHTQQNPINNQNSSSRQARPVSRGSYISITDDQPDPIPDSIASWHSDNGVSIPMEQYPSRARHEIERPQPHPQPHQYEEVDSVKLGLGDFVFYSVLVSRSVLFGFVTAAASFIAILMGLSLTLSCFALKRRALPALPFSIAIATAMYFSTRFLVWPFIVQLTLQALLP